MGHFPLRGLQSIRPSSFVPVGQPSQWGGREGALCFFTTGTTSLELNKRNVRCEFAPDAPDAPVIRLAWSGPQQLQQSQAGVCCCGMRVILRVCESTGHACTCNTCEVLSSSHSPDVPTHVLNHRLHAAGMEHCKPPTLKGHPASAVPSLLFPAVLCAVTARVCCS